MIRLTLEDIAAVTGGAVDGGPGSTVVDGPAVLDSRAVTPGALFVAFVGQRVDGHEFAAAAVTVGAAGVLASRPVGVPAVVVPDTVTALATLAAYSRRALPELSVVGITGSSGKTSCKDLVAALLEEAGPTIAPPGSYNNDLGAPLTVLRADTTTRHLVVEMGARGHGHIARLAAMAGPDIGVVLNVGQAHASEFGSLAATAAAKGELVEALAADGVAVLNADDPLVSAMAARTRARVVAFGGAPTADVRAEDVTVDRTGRASFTLVTPEGSAAVRLALHGEHHVSNALAAAAVAREAGVGVARIAEVLAATGPRSPGRMWVTERPDGVTVVDDSYNANPESVRAGLKALVAMAQGRRSWAVLGEMLELGEGSAREHDAIGRLAVRLDVSRLVVVGAGARPMHLGAHLEGSWGDESVFVPDTDAALELLRSELTAGDVVLVKASRGAGLDRVVRGLLPEGAA